MAEPVEEKTHARKGPSGADTWAVCYGAPALCDGKPNNSSVYARWGTCAHEVAGLILATAVVEGDANGAMVWSPENAEGYVGRVFQIEGFDVEFDMEMADCVNDYVAEVESYWEPGDIMLVEQAVPIDHITGEEGATGTSDCIIIKPAKREIVGIDLKGGKGVAVYAEDNRQAAMYTDGAIVEHDLFHGPFDWVTSVIIQPRLQSVSEHRVSREEHDAFIEELKVSAIVSALADKDYVQFGATQEWVDQYLNPGEKQCRFCDAKATCPALRGVVTDTLRSTAASPDDFPEITDWSDEAIHARQTEANKISLPKQAAAATVGPDTDAAALAEAKRSLKLIASWIEGVETEVQRRLFDGQDVPGFGLFTGSEGNRGWKDPAAAEAALKKAKLKADEMYSKKLISYPQAEKLLKDKPKVWAVLAGNVSRSPAQPMVAPIDCGKDPWTPVPAAEDFPELEDDLFA